RNRAKKTFSSGLHLIIVWRTLVAFAQANQKVSFCDCCFYPGQFHSTPASWRLYSPKKDRMKNIYVGNLDFNITEDELRQAFAAYGQVDNVTILKDRDTGQPRGFGFVEMANDEEAEKAINGINGTQLGSRTLNVNEARPKVSKGGFGGGGGRGNRQGGRGGGGFRNRY